MKSKILMSLFTLVFVFAVSTIKAQTTPAKEDVKTEKSAVDCKTQGCKFVDANNDGICDNCKAKCGANSKCEKSGKMCKGKKKGACCSEAKTSCKSQSDSTAVKACCKSKKMKKGCCPGKTE